MHARCHVCRVGQRCLAPVALPRYGHSGVNAAFCTLFNGSSKTLPEVLAVADAISPSIADPRVDHGQRHGVRTVKISHKVLPPLGSCRTLKKEVK